MKVLVINCGSSSLKYQLIDSETEQALASGLCERIGIDGQLTHKVDGKKIKDEEKIAMPDHEVAAKIVLDQLIAEEYGVIASLDEINAVGHRVVHGGEFYSNSVLIDDEVIRNIEKLSKLAPLHNPVNLVGINAFLEALPKAVQVAVFDTAFHQTMNPCTYLYPLPYEYYEMYKIRKYGFHGTSHYYVTRKVAELMDKDIDQLNIISVHLGGGASITAVKNGKSVNTSMGFTPLAGIMMGTRTGDVDPAILPFIMDEENLTTSEVLEIFNHHSGMYGVSGISSDARDILEAAANGNKRAILTLEMYTDRIAEVIGSYYIRLNKVDAIVFTGGIGENAGTIRSDIFKQIFENDDQKTQNA